MEVTIGILGTLIVLIYFLYIVIIKPVMHASKYMQFVEEAIKAISSEENLTTSGYKNRVERIQAIGLLNELVNNLLTLRLTARKDYKIDTKYFDTNGAVKKIENQLSYTYASVYAPQIKITPDDIDIVNKEVSNLDNEKEEVINLAQSLQKKRK